jgi:glycosyltransferase involved in cell wall biosynthesis
MPDLQQKSLVSVVCPVRNEAGCIQIFYSRFKNATQDLEPRYDFELIFTNNASTDETLDTIKNLRTIDNRIFVVTLSRNFGYQASLVAGLRQARGDAIIIIDVDCEDPPELIPAFILGWEKGNDIVYGIRGKRNEPFFLQQLRRLFYRLMNRIADNNFILDMAEFALLSRRVRDAIQDNAKSFPFIRAELGYVGFRIHGIPYDRGNRVQGYSHYNLFRITQFAVGGVLTSSTFFLRLIVYLGVPLAAVNLLLGLLSLFISTSRLAGSLAYLNSAFIVTTLSILAAYVARIYKDVLNRPLYIIDWKQSIVAGVPRPEIGTEQALVEN